ncbi:MAG: hypothetical protein DRG82_04065 [Deltaproteobacteria bacterium]|nr:MAG: hypothetical protein B1H13_03980 [Desulfobacteraceae bacterium 4484_190.3]RLB18350.1 MAG: hypothetical protein DRG82_04065 [Deltaproteobacteria bacterium]
MVEGPQQSFCEHDGGISLKWEALLSKAAGNRINSLAHCNAWEQILLPPFVELLRRMELQWLIMQLNLFD